MFRVAILTISDKGAEEGKNKNSVVITNIIERINGKKVYYESISDEYELIREKLFNISENSLADLILTTGGIGFAKKDVTPEATLDVIEKEVPGLTEKMRWETCKKSPMASLSRARAGISKSTLIVNLPDNPEEISECLEAIIDVIPRGLDILKGHVKEYS